MFETNSISENIKTSVFNLPFKKYEEGFYLKLKDYFLRNLKYAARRFIPHETQLPPSYNYSNTFNNRHLDA